MENEISLGVKLLSFNNIHKVTFCATKLINDISILDSRSKAQKRLSTTIC
jgi:hypothetical protein